MPILTITDEDEVELLRLHITQTVNSATVLAILKALESIPKPRKPRSGAGRKRESKGETL
jgi:hypothetical protein